MPGATHAGRHVSPAWLAAQTTALRQPAGAAAHHSMHAHCSRVEGMCPPFPAQARNGEQMLNAVAHAANHPLLVRHRAKLRIEDVRWLAEFTFTAETRRESEELRTRVAKLMDGGLAPLRGDIEAGTPETKM